MQNFMVTIIKKFHERIEQLQPRYAKQAFVEYVCQSLKHSQNIGIDASKLIKELEVNLEEKWRDFLKMFLTNAKMKLGLIMKASYPEYSEDEQYLNFLLRAISEHATPLEATQEIEATLQNSRMTQIPFKWEEYLANNFDRELFQRLEKVRLDPQFEAYYSHMMSLKGVAYNESQQEKDLRKYLDVLPRLHDIIARKLYFVFRNKEKASAFKYLEHHFDGYKNQKEKSLNHKKNPPKSQQPAHNLTEISSNGQKKEGNLGEYRYSLDQKLYAEQIANYDVKPSHKIQIIRTLIVPEKNEMKNLNQPQQIVQKKANPGYQPTHGPQRQAQVEMRPSAISPPTIPRQNGVEKMIPSQNVNQPLSPSYQQTQCSKPKPKVNPQLTPQTDETVQSPELQDCSEDSIPDQNQGLSSFPVGVYLDKIEKSSHKEVPAERQYVSEWKQIFDMFGINEDAIAIFIENEKRKEQEEAKIEEAQRIKRVKHNPAPEKELNLCPSQPKTSLPTLLKKNAQGIPIIPASYSAFASALQELGQDSRFTVEIKEDRYLDYLEINVSKRTHQGLTSTYDKIKLTISKDSSNNEFKVQVVSMPNLKEFLSRHGNEVEEALGAKDIRSIIELWSQFLNLRLEALNAKLFEFNEIFHSPLSRSNNVA